jgi:V/A-type H+-transporting ATPase subunit D
MSKVKLTKGELKRQRDALAQYERFLPTLQLKKQQLQIEIAHQQLLLAEKNHSLQNKTQAAAVWSRLLGENPGLSSFIRPKEMLRAIKNIAGVDLPVFARLEFAPADYDLFLMPLWVDFAVEALRVLVALRAEIRVLEEGIGLLRQELRVTAQRVNLFEKVKIPQAQEAIRLIKIYIGDQMTNAVGRCKAAKRKIEEEELSLAAA